MEVAMKNIIDAHNHCIEFSPDASQKLDERIEEARKLGLKGLVMTDHFDKLVDEEVYQDGFQIIDRQPMTGEWIFNFPEYIRFMQNKQSEIEAQKLDFKLFIGVEIGYHPDLVEAWRACVDHYEVLDCVIGSVHNLKFMDTNSLHEAYAKGKHYAYSLYLEAIIDMLEEMPFINVLGHFDYICRYNAYDNKTILYSEFADLFDRIFKLLIKNEIALEINTGTQKVRDNSGKPLGLIDDEILARYLAKGGRHIVLSSDAHHKARVGQLFAENIAHLKQLGYQEISYYKKRKAYFDVL